MAFHTDVDSSIRDVGVLNAEIGGENSGMGVRSHYDQTYAYVAPKLFMICKVLASHSGDSEEFTT
jgi:hypothetical protein